MPSRNWGQIPNKTVLITAYSRSSPRLRHGFAVGCLLRWYQEGADVQSRLPWLSAYLGHKDLRSTYWYLSAAPELLACAARLPDARDQEAAP
jgi:integrase/recombinase XerD